MPKLKSIYLIDDHSIVFIGIQHIFQADKLEFDMQNCKNGNDTLNI